MPLLVGLLDDSEGVDPLGLPPNEANNLSDILCEVLQLARLIKESAGRQELVAFAA